MERFPFPFGGVTQGIGGFSEPGLRTAMNHLVTCHGHSFAVDVDNKVIYVSESGAECLFRLFKKPTKPNLEVITLDK